MEIETVDVHNGQVQLSELLSLVAAGTEVILTEGARPLARLVPIDTTSDQPISGLHANAGAAWTNDDEEITPMTVREVLDYLEEKLRTSPSPTARVYKVIDQEGNHREFKSEVRIREHMNYATGQVWIEVPVSIWIEHWLVQEQYNLEVKPWIDALPVGEGVRFALLDMFGKITSVDDIEGYREEFEGELDRDLSKFLQDIPDDEEEDDDTLDQDVAMFLKHTRDDEHGEK